MLLEVGIALRDKTPDYTLKRDAISLDTPDGKTLPLPSVEGAPQGQHQRTFRPDARAARLDQLLPADGVAGVPHRFLLRSGPACDAVGPGRDQQLRACLGRLYFHIPGGIAYGRTGST